MIWTDKHDEVCCEIFIDKVLKKDFCSSKTKAELIKLAKEKGLPQPESSISMKFQNITAICEDNGITHNSPFKPLSNYSKKGLRCFERVYAKHLLEKLKTPTNESFEN